MPHNTLINLINTYPDKSWDWYVLSFNPNITFDVVKNYPDYF